MNIKLIFSKILLILFFFTSNLYSVDEFDINLLTEKINR